MEKAVDPVEQGPPPERRGGILARLPFVSSEPKAPRELSDLLRVFSGGDGKADVQTIRRAYEVAERSHRGQVRKSGDPFISHPLGVASILAEMGLDTTTVVAALLHDVVEDTAVTLDQVRSEFGEEVTAIVDGLTKFDKIEYRSREQEQAENVRKMIIAMAR
ncbi:MAG TPA: HD domain-containing protein, partial [Actinomycetota bacterium]|nr:HD domain-containing protein [Actinomycetota bacterium]